MGFTELRNGIELTHERLRKVQCFVGSGEGLQRRNAEGSPEQRSGSGRNEQDVIGVVGIQKVRRVGACQILDGEEVGGLQGLLMLDVAGGVKFPRKAEGSR